MSLLKKLMLAAVVAVAPVVATAPAAAAQTTVIVIDEAKILRDSKAGKHIKAELDKLEKSMENELKPTATQLETDGKSIQTSVQGKTREQVAGDAALVSRIEGYQKKAGEFAQKRGKVAQEFALTERKALVDFNAALEPVLKDVVAEKKADIVLSRNQVVFGGPTVDATASVISKLDARTPTISVTRQRIPAGK